jgi:putative ABC transport system ATP-binding protein
LGINKKFEQLVKEHVNVLKLGLENKLHQLMGTLSGGQRQALTLVMGTMDDCKLMLLDEPTAALDPRSAALVMEKANDIIAMNKLTAILVTHNMKDALQFGNRLIQMKEGVIVRDLNEEKKTTLVPEELYRWFD